MNKTIKTDERTYRVSDLRLIKPKKLLTEEDTQLVRDWVAELRSGNKTQGHNQLHGIAADRSEFFCCLGVLCSLVPDLDRVLHLPISFSGPDRDPDGYLYNGAGSYLPSDLADRLGVETNPKVGDLAEKDPFKYTSLGYLNDEGATFEQIAQIIAQSWLGEDPAT